MRRCTQKDCKKYNNGYCKTDPEVSRKGACLEYDPDECKFILASGKCCKKTVSKSDYCQDHKDAKCVSCGKPATQECMWQVNDDGGICGAFLCDNPGCFKKHKADVHEEKPVSRVNN